MHRKSRIIDVLLASFVVVVSITGEAKSAATSRGYQVQIVAEEMCCKGCARKVSGQLYATKGVTDVEVNMKTRVVSVSLPQPSTETLGQLWHAVEQGDGGPTKMITSEATYTLFRPQLEAGQVAPDQPTNFSLRVAIDNLHCQGCAKKIAAQLYAIKGVTKVSVDMQNEIMVVESRPDAAVSPWQIVNACAKAKERPLAVVGPHGKLTIEWATQSAPKNHQQAQQVTGGIQR